MSTSRQSQPSWTKHSPDELAYSRHVDREWFYFVSDSESRPGRVNTTGYRPADGATTCDCIHTPRRLADGSMSHCWHVHWAPESFTRDLCRRVAEAKVATMTDAQLMSEGLRAAALVERGRRCAVFASPLDSAMLTAARSQWLARRAASRPARVVEMPAAALVAA